MAAEMHVSALVLAAESPYPLAGGGALRTASLLQYLALGYDVKRLRRYQIGAFRLKGIPLRGARHLSTKEIELLFQTPRAFHHAPDFSHHAHED